MVALSPGNFLALKGRGKMTDYKLAKDQHLTIEAREEIQKCLEVGVSFKDIARRVGKSPTTISR
jgi:uncharacterized protein YerC